MRVRGGSFQFLMASRERKRPESTPNLGSLTLPARQEWIAHETRHPPRNAAQPSATNFLLHPASRRPCGRQLLPRLVTASWPPTRIFAISPYVPRRKLTARLSATWPPTFTPPPRDDQLAIDADNSWGM